MARGRLLTEDRRVWRERTASVGRLWTNPQHRLFSSPYALTVFWGANGIGKSYAIAELARRAIAGELLARQSDAPGLATSDELAGMRKSLRHMHAFYTLMERFYHDFSAQWAAERQRLGERITQEEKSST